MLMVWLVTVGADYKLYYHYHALNLKVRCNNVTSGAYHFIVPLSIANDGTNIHHVHARSCRYRALDGRVPTISGICSGIDLSFE